MKLTPEQFYKLKATTLELQFLRVQLERQFAVAEQKQREVILEMGLDPSLNYTLNDATFCAEVPPVAHTADTTRKGQRTPR